jgi:aspartate kinase
MLSVLKIGGSVLRDTNAFRATAAFIADRLASLEDERLVIIVSAEYGTTDALLAEATTITAEPNGDALDLLWSTGEVRSVALLALHLQQAGVRTEGLNVHQTGLTWSEGATHVRPLRILAALADARVAIVPGFLAVRSGGGIRSLGRGGSDLTAVLLAAALRADRCELIKDVAGYYTADPHEHADAAPIRSLTFERALAMAHDGCDLVQPAALEAARRSALPLIVRSLAIAAPVTQVFTKFTDREEQAFRLRQDSGETAAASAKAVRPA